MVITLNHEDYATTTERSLYKYGAEIESGIKIILPNTDSIHIYQTYPNVSMSIKGNNNAYPSGSAVTDKYYNASLDKRILSKNTQFGNPYNTNNIITNVNGENLGSQSAVMSLSGKPINVDDFGHNNMVPFFGARVRGSTAGADTHESILDSYSGTGTQKICKEERAPLFAPQTNIQYPMVCPIIATLLSRA